MQGKKLFFVTNNSTKSRKGYLGKFTKLGLNISAEEIYSSSYAAAAYLESISFPSDKKVCTYTCGKVLQAAQVFDLHSQAQMQFDDAGSRSCNSCCWSVTGCTTILEIHIFWNGG